MNITDVIILIAMCFGPSSLLYLVFSDLAAGESNRDTASIYRRICEGAAVAVWAAATLRCLLTLCCSRYANKMATFNEANDVGDEHSRSLLHALYCKEYLRF